MGTPIALIADNRNYMGSARALLVVCLLIFVVGVTMMVFALVSRRKGSPPPAPPPVPQETLLGQSVEGRPLTAYALGTGADVTLVLGGFHGDEPAGPIVARQLLTYLCENPSSLTGRKVVIVPECNPDGLARKTRVNARGVDINRNWPTSDWQPAGSSDRYSPGPSPESEPETAALRAFVDALRPAKVINLHQPLHLLNPTGRGAELARIMAQCNGYKISEDVGHPTPGSFGTYCGVNLGATMVTLEFDDESGEEAWEHNREALLAAIEAQL